MENVNLYSETEDRKTFQREVMAEKSDVDESAKPNSRVSTVV